MGLGLAGARAHRPKLETHVQNKLHKWTADVFRPDHEQSTFMRLVVEKCKVALRCANAYVELDDPDVEAQVELDIFPTLNIHIDSELRTKQMIIAAYSVGKHLRPQRVFEVF